MNKYLILLITIILHANLSVSKTYGSSVYEFHVDTGEGTLEIYRIVADFVKERGELCFLHSERSNVPDEIKNKVRNGTKWSTVINMDQYEHACSNFDIYEPSTWFYSSPIRYSEADYVFFFVGGMNSNKIEGILYRFRKFSPKGNSSSYKTTRLIEIAADGIDKPTRLK